VLSKAKWALQIGRKNSVQKHLSDHCHVEVKQEVHCKSVRRHKQVQQRSQYAAQPQVVASGLRIQRQKYESHSERATLSRFPSQERPRRQRTRREGRRHWWRLERRALQWAGGTSPEQASQEATKRRGRPSWSGQQGTTRAQVGQSTPEPEEAPPVAAVAGKRMPAVCGRRPAQQTE
jgi:hypothetical protein